MNKVGTKKDKFNPALILLPFWSELIYFWCAAENLNLKWHDGFAKRLTANHVSNSDIDWLIRAMQHTFDALPDQADIKADYESFLRLNEIYNWHEAYRIAFDTVNYGPEWTAYIHGDGYSLVRTVRATDREAAERKLTGRDEKIGKWLMPRQGEAEIVDCRTS